MKNDMSIIVILKIEDQNEMLKETIIVINHLLD